MDIFSFLMTLYAKELGEQNAADIETLKAGMTYKGEVADYAHLPSTHNEEGDIWKTLDTGNKYIWSNIQGTDQWSLWDEPSGGITQQEADARYLQLSGGAMTGHIALTNGAVITDSSTYNLVGKDNATSTVTFSNHLCITKIQSAGSQNLIHRRGSTDYNILDTYNTEVNPTLAGTEAALESLKLNGVNYKNQPSSMQVLTTAPTAANNDGIKIVILSSEPATKYNGYLYLITGA